MRDDRSRNRSKEAGFALILAILALMLLTFLGLTLAATTSTELQVANNYRWSVQARYNAEAGIEAAKEIMQGLNWAAILPTARLTPWTPSTTIPITGAPPAVPFPGATRNFELGSCDARGNGMGYGVVLHDGTRAYENVTTVPGLTVAPPGLNGAFTLWIRRPLSLSAAGSYVDDNSTTDALVLTAEGVAPYVDTALGTVFARANMARRVVEVSVRRQAQPAPCGTRGGQVGGGPEGNNAFGGPCGGLGANALGNYTGAGGFITGSGQGQ